MNKKPGIDFSFCWPVAELTTPEAGLPQLREFGFEGIELWPQVLEKYGGPRWAEALASNGMRCFQLCPYFNFVSGPEKIRQSHEMLQAYLETARILSCNRLRVFTGPPWGEGVVGAREATTEQWQSAIDCLREFCDEAPAIEFCLECHEGSLMEDSVSALRLIHGVNHPNLTVNLQLPLREEDWQSSLRQLSRYTTHLHIHNWTRGLGEGDLTFLAEGAFDWLPVVRSLVDCGRRVCLSIEHADHGGRHDPWETARRDGPYLRQLRDNICAARSTPIQP